MITTEQLLAARLKMQQQQERLNAREAEREERREQGRPSRVAVHLAMLAGSLLLLYIGVEGLMNHPWRDGPPPLQPIPSAPPTPTPHRGPMHGSECGPNATPDEVCVDVGPLMPIVQCANNGTCPPINNPTTTVPTTVTATVTATVPAPPTWTSPGNINYCSTEYPAPPFGNMCYEINRFGGQGKWCDPTSPVGDCPWMRGRGY